MQDIFRISTLAEQNLIIIIIIIIIGTRFNNF